MMCKLCNHKVRDAVGYPCALQFSHMPAAETLTRLFVFRAYTQHMWQELPRQPDPDRRWPRFVTECQACRTDYDRWTHYGFVHAAGVAADEDVPGMSWSINLSLALSRAVSNRQPFVHVIAVYKQQMERTSELNSRLCCLWDMRQRELRRCRMTEPDFEKHGFDAKKMRQTLCCSTALREVVMDRELVNDLPSFTVRPEQFTNKMTQQARRYWYFNECSDPAWRKYEMELRSHVLTLCARDDRDSWLRYYRTSDPLTESP